MHILCQLQHSDSSLGSIRTWLVGCLRNMSPEYLQDSLPCPFSADTVYESCLGNFLKSSILCSLSLHFCGPETQSVGSEHVCNLDELCPLSQTEVPSVLQTLRSCEHGHSSMELASLKPGAPVAPDVRC